MAYSDFFKHADDVIDDLNSYVPTLTDPLVQMKYIGFVTVVAVTVYELAVKDIFINFARKKNKVFGEFTENFFNRINGRIRLKIIKDDYIKKFGNKYLDKFNKNLELESKNYLKQYKRDFISAYSNLIIWRNNFAHEGKIRNQNTTYAEVVQAYEDGKQLLHCLDQSMVDE